MSKPSIQEPGTLSTLATAERQSDILAALRGLKGRASVGDVVAATGLGTDESEAALKALLDSHHGHLAVTESGELLYHFDPKLIRRGTEPLLARVKRRAWDLFAKAFKAWIVVMLVVYFVVFVVLVLAALFANERGGGNRRSGGWGGRGRHRSGGVFPVPNFWLWYWIWGPRWRIGRPYYGHRWERTLEKDDKVPFYKKVFAFVFGPDRPKPTQPQLDRGTIRLIRARNGVVTEAELVEYTGLPAEEAKDEMGRLVGAYAGEPVVSPEGELAYAFPALVTSAHGRVGAREPHPAWMRLEYPLELTGNTAGANALVAGMNGFTLVAAATSPWFIFPRLGIGGAAAVVGLIVIPVIFSLMFFAVPALRMLGVKRENRARARRNLRRVTLGLVYARALGDSSGAGGGVTVDEAFEHAAKKLEHEAARRAVRREDVEAELNRIAAEFDADVSPDEAGRLVFRFPSIERAFVAGERVRRGLALDERTLGGVVFDTSDSAAAAGARDLAAFDKEMARLAAEEVDVRGYMPSPERVRYEADYEVVAFDEELRDRGVALA